jgi:hypothetical protein
MKCYTIEEILQVLKIILLKWLDRDIGYIYIYICTVYLYYIFL